MKNLFLFTTLLLVSITFGQTKEKIKGSRIVTQSVIEIENFTSIELEDNFEIILSKADKPSLEIAADDNLHDVINTAIVNGNLKIASLKDVSRAKKFSVRINYTDSLNFILAKNETKISSLNTVELNNLTVKAYGKSEIVCKADVKNLNLILDEKANAELSINAENTNIEISQYANLEAIINNSETTKIDIYQKGKAEIDGKTNTLKLRLDNNANLTAKKFTAKEITLSAEGYSKISVFADDNITISASGKSEIDLYGAPKIELPQFTNSASLRKKE